MGTHGSHAVLELYNRSLGRPTAAMRGDFRKQYDDILKVNHYGDFLKRMGCVNWAANTLTSLLRNAIRSALVSDYIKMFRNRIKGSLRYEEIPPADISQYPFLPPDSAASMTTRMHRSVSNPGPYRNSGSSHPRQHQRSDPKNDNKGGKKDTDSKSDIGGKWERGHKQHASKK